MIVKNKTALIHRLLGATAISLVTAANAYGGAGDCSLVDGVLPQGCDQKNAGTVVNMPAGENNELDRGRVAAPEGFLISVNGETVHGDKRVEDVIRRTDIALSKADVQVKFDGLGVTPRLDLETVGKPRAYEAGDTVTFQSATNYPAWLKRGEVRIIDRSAAGGPRTIAILPIKPNGRASVTLPQGRDLVAVHRVYDAHGRYDETDALPLMRRDDRGLIDGVDDGNDSTTRRRIPVSGGAVTVFGTSIASGAKVSVMGESVRTDPSGKFVLQRILPAGDHAVDVDIHGNGQNVHLVRDLTIPKSEWFYIGTADLTFGYRDQEIAGSSDTYTKGRLAFYAKGKTQQDATVTAAADTGESDIEDLFRDFNDRDPRQLLLRIDPDQYYPTYGDDSTFEEDAPTSGKFYLKVERDGNFALWGNYKARLLGSDYLRNERTLYGAEGFWASQRQTSNGDAKAELTFYAASPDNLPQRDVFRGTGGSVYFLRRQDLSVGSETVSVEVRDGVTGRVLSRRTLVYGRDYDINYLQGVITLTSPLGGFTGGGVVVTTPGGEETVNLVAQYEYTPTAGSLDGMSYGGRVQSWANDKLRFGFTGMVEKTGAADQTAYGADILYQLSEGTYAKLEYARSEGPGFGFSSSSDGGLVVVDTAASGGTGDAVKTELRADLKDLGLTTEGFLSAYYEKRNLGFSTLDYQVTATTGDETLWGLSAEVQQTERLRWSLYYDDYKNAVGDIKREGGVELTFATNDRLTYALGIEHTDKKTATENGRRTDVALRATLKPNDRLEWFVFGQATLDNSGLPENNRIGAGLSYDFGNGWSVEGELSDGNLGTGGKALLSYESDKNNSLYFGYELDPDREITGVTLTGRDHGKFIFGGKKRINDDISTYAENTYDLFGARRSLTSAYGVEYTPSSFVAYTGALEIGTIRDSISGDFDRTALSFGVRYQDERLSARGRLEFRRERGVLGGPARKSDTVLLTSTARYKIDETQRLVFNLDATKTTGTSSTILNGDIVDASFGYAYRPIDNDRLNVLIKYRFLYDMYGQRLNGTDTPGPRQKSHVFSIDASYDLDRHWTLGGKYGIRLSDSSPDAATAFSRNDAWLAVVNARYHLVHNWDGLIEARVLKARQAGTTQYGVLGAVYRHMGNNVKLGVGYNFGRFSDDLTDLTFDDRGIFVNLVAKF